MVWGCRININPHPEKARELDLFQTQGFSAKWLQLYFLFSNDQAFIPTSYGYLFAAKPRKLNQAGV
jgi:hypothetical protein